MLMNQKPTQYCKAIIHQLKINNFKRICIYIHIYIHTIDYYSAIQKNEIMPFTAPWIDLESIISNEVSQKEKDKYHMISLTCAILKTDISELIYQTDIESKFMVTKEDGVGGDQERESMNLG